MMNLRSVFAFLLLLPTGTAIGSGNTTGSLVTVSLANNASVACLSNISTGVESCRGIRFGEAERWRPPTLVVPSGSVNNNSTYGAACPQTFSSDYATDMVFDEDCLYLNVYRPLGTKEDDELPVIAFIHGTYFTCAYA